MNILEFFKINWDSKVNTLLIQKCNIGYNIIKFFMKKYLLINN